MYPIYKRQLKRVFNHIFKGSIFRGVSTPTYGFITEWTVAGDASARTITLPLTNNGTFNATVDWGDGSGTSTITSYDDADRIHTYAGDGTYEVEITGDLPGWSFNNGGDKLKITKVINWGSSSSFSGFSYLTSGFYGCTNLTSVGTTSIQATASLADVTELFRGCTSITSIEGDLFQNCTNLTVSAFYSTFRGCTSLTTIPTDLFKYNTAVSANGFYAVFYQCTSLTALPTDLFKYNTAVSTNGFFAAFSGNTALATVPSELFRFNTSVAGELGFYATFQFCNKLQLVIDLFYASGEESTRFLNQSPVFTNCFDRSSFTGTQGTAPDLWNCDFGTGTPTTGGCYGGAGNSLTSLDNYGSVPAGYK